MSIRHQTFYEHGAVGVLTTFLKGSFGKEERLVETRDETCGVVAVEERLTGTVSAGRIVRIAIGTAAVLAVVEEQNALIGDDGWGSALRELTVETALAGAHHLEQVALRVEQRGPVDQVGRRSHVYPCLAPI